MKRILLILSFLLSSASAFSQGDTKTPFATTTFPIANRYAYTNNGLWFDSTLKARKYRAPSISDTVFIAIDTGGKGYQYNLQYLKNLIASGSGGVPTTRAIEINGVSQDLSADRTWTLGLTEIANSSSTGHEYNGFLLMKYLHLVSTGSGSSGTEGKLSADSLSGSDKTYLLPNSNSGFIPMSVNGNRAKSNGDVRDSTYARNDSLFAWKDGAEYFIEDWVGDCPASFEWSDFVDYFNIDPTCSDMCNGYVYIEPPAGYTVYLDGVLYDLNDPNDTYCAGIHLVEVIPDANPSCKTLLTFVLTDPPPVTLKITRVEFPTTSTSADGKFMLAATGATNVTVNGIAYNPALPQAYTYGKYAIHAYTTNAGVQCSAYDTVYMDTLRYQRQIQFKDESNDRGVKGAIRYVDFTGAGVTVTLVGDTAITVDIPASSSTAGHVIQSNSSNMTQRANLNFSTQFTVTDDAGNNQTDVSVNVVEEDIIDGVTDKAPSENMVYDALQGKQNTLVSGTTIKTVNGNSLLASGNLSIKDQAYHIYSALGGSIKAETVPLSQVTVTNNLADGWMVFYSIYLPEAATLTGVKWWQQNQGAYTADNENRVGLYSYSAGTLTLVASSTDDGNIWKASGQTWATKAFTTPYAAAAGTYFVGALYNSSAQTTSAGLGSNTSLIWGGVETMDFTNSGRLYGVLTGQNTLPASFAASSASNYNQIIYFGVY